MTMSLFISPTLNDWIALIAFNVTVVGLSSLAEKRTVIGIEYGKYLLDRFKWLGVFRIYHILVGVALVNVVSLVVMLHPECSPVLTTIVYSCLVLSSIFVLYYLFAYVLRIHPAVKKSIYRKQLLGLYIDSDAKCDFEGDVVIGMPPGDRTPKKITSDVQSFFDRFDEETISAFHEVFGSSSLIYSRDVLTMREWKHLGYGMPHDYRVHKRDEDRTPTNVVHISWEFFQMFRFSEIQDRWVLEILNIFNGSYADAYPRLRLYNVASVFGQINRVGFSEGLYRYKFLDYMLPHIVRALDPTKDENRQERIPVERYFHIQFGQYLHDTMLHHPAATFTQSARKALTAIISIEKFRGVIPVKDRIPCYQQSDLVEAYDSLLREVVRDWEKESARIKNLVFDFGNVLVGWDPDNLYGKKGEACFRSESRYKRFRREVLTPMWLRKLDSQLDMHDVVEERCAEYPSYRKALRMYETEWMKTLSGEIAGMSELIKSLPEEIRVLGLSNWCASTFTLAREKYPVLKLINDFLISGGLASANGTPIPPKPEPSIYKELIDRFELSPEACLFIDDTYDNVKAARYLGMKSLWFTDAENLRLALEPVVSRSVRWGENRALWMMPIGLDPSKVVVESFDSTTYSFSDDELQKDFARYEYLNHVCGRDDQSKCMLLDYGYDSSNNLLSLKLKRTKWRYCQFVWNHRFDGIEDGEKKLKEWHNRIIYEHLSGERVIRYPNSFCLHLVIETVDGNILVTDISKRKMNDYPATKAFTIGEQLEESDIRDSSGLVITWVRRAVFEKFGFSKASFEAHFDASSLRILSLDLEEDIYNFALVCTIKMRRSYAQFKKAAKLDKSELAGVSELPLQEVPSILLGYPENRSMYHPSSYMRLLVFYIYKEGMQKAREELKF